jgi:hypothetical protein
VPGVNVIMNNTPNQSSQVRFVSDLFDGIASVSSEVSFKLCHILQNFNNKTCKLLDDEN